MKRFKLLKSFRWRLLLSTLIILLAFFVVVGWTVVHYVEKFYQDNLRQEMLYESRLITKLVQDYDFDHPSPELMQVAQSAGEDTRARITIIASDGRVLADSKEDAATMANHSDRPEVAAALRGLDSSSTRYSATLNMEMLYMAVPVQEDSRIKGVVRMALPVDSINALLYDIWLIIFLTILGAGIVASWFSFRFISRLTRPIYEITKAAQAMTKGNLKRRVHYNQEDEIGLLAAAINTMAANLDEKINEISVVKKRLETVLENTVNGVILIDFQRQIVYINPQACKMFNVEQEAALGKRVIEVTRSYALAEAVDAVHSGNEPIKRDFVLYNLGEKTVEANIVPVVYDIELGVLVVLNDISELKRLATVRQEFVANVSHELRTPVTAISGFAETLMAEAPDNPMVQEFARIIFEEANRLGRLVTSLLELSKIESDGPGFNLQIFDLKECIESARDLITPRLLEKELSIILNLPEDTVMVNADWDRITQVMINLLDNAINHSFTNQQITVSLSIRNSQALVEVADQGLGISGEETSRVFERFYRVDKSRNRKNGGMGLGLSIVKHIIEAHRGSVGVYSKYGQGSTFYFMLPLSPEHGDKSCNED